MAYQPCEPGYNCPDIDTAIAKLEEVRDNCTKLRNWGTEWQEIADEREKERDELQDEVDSLAKDIDALREELNELKKEPA